MEPRGSIWNPCWFSEEEPLIKKKPDPLNPTKGFYIEPLGGAIYETRNRTLGYILNLFFKDCVVDTHASRSKLKTSNTVTAQ